MKYPYLLFALLMWTVTGLAQEKVMPSPAQSTATEEEREIFKIVEQMPSFPGCELAGDRQAISDCSKEKLAKFVYTKLLYPAEARQNSVEGQVVLQWVIEADGSISNETLLRDIGGGCGAAALDVIRQMKEMPEKWTPGKQRGRPVAVLYTLPVKFNLGGVSWSSLDVLNEVISSLEGGCDCVGTFSSLRDAEASGFITLNKKEEIIGLNFQAAGLKGEIPAAIGDLKKMEWINLEYNYLTGGLPNDIVKLKNLEELLLNGNHLVITEEMTKGKSSRLQLIDIDDNFPKVEAEEGKIELNDKGAQIFKVVETMPRFPGCEDEATESLRKKCADEKMLQFIYKTLKYPAKAREQGVEGMVVLQFVIKPDGLIRDITIKRDPGAGCGNAAAWVVNRMNYMQERWTPGTQRNRPVAVMYTLPVKFKLQ